MVMWRTSLYRFPLTLAVAALVRRPDLSTMLTSAPQFGNPCFSGFSAECATSCRAAGVSFVFDSYEFQAFMRSPVAARSVQPKLSPHPRIRNILAVGSGKGGVGKSTTAVNLALALAAGGARVGVLDADVYAPSVPAMLGLSGRPDSPDGKSIEPMRAQGLEAMSLGMLVDQDTPMIWRGPMATSALTQLLTDTLWGGEEGLDYLVIDLPPGTGDIQLTLAQKIPVAGAVVVTTPQDIATLDAKKALKM